MSGLGFNISSGVLCTMELSLKPKVYKMQQFEAIIFKIFRESMSPAPPRGQGPPALGAYYFSYSAYYYKTFHMTGSSKDDPKIAN